MGAEQTRPNIAGYSGLILLGAGGSGAVYRAQDDRHNRSVAIKVLVGQSLDATIRQSFEREIQAMGKLSGHPNIITLHDSGFTPNGEPFFVMPLYDEGSLGDRIKSNTSTPWPDVVDIGVQILSALSIAHASNVLHRDIKPDNIFVDSYGRVALGDFGISTFSDSGSTTTKAVAYTVRYAAPEIFHGNKQSKSSDIYSTGVALYELLRGGPAFDTETAASTMRNILDGTPKPPAVNVPAPLQRLVGQMMAVESAQRPSSAEEVVRSLQAIQRSHGFDPTPSWLENAPAQPMTTTAPTQSEHASPPADSRRVESAPASPRRTSIQRDPPTAVTQHANQRQPTYPTTFNQFVSSGGGAQRVRAKGNTGLVIGAVVSVVVLLMVSAVGLQLWFASSSGAEGEQADQDPAGPVEPGDTGELAALSEVLTGTWEGTYECELGVASLTLTMVASPNGDLQGLFEFTNIEGGADFETGSYVMAGTFTEDSVTLDGDRWVDQPFGYGFVDLRGPTPQTNDATFAGDAPICIRFSLLKSSDAAKEIPR